VTNGTSVSSPTFTNCSISNNVVSANGGGGLFFDAQSPNTSFPAFTNCTFSSNAMATNSAQPGGAMWRLVQ
jgi:hypothetical protein